MTSTPHYVLLWREAPSRRLRTYTNEEGVPIASPLDKISPRPTTIIDTAETLTAWLDSESDSESVALLDALVVSELGWRLSRSSVES